MTRSRDILAPRRFWSESDLKVLREEYPSRPSSEIAKALGRSLASVYGTAKKMGLKKTAERIAECGIQKGSGLGRQYRFPKGHAPVNKGVKRPGWHAGRMRETQFKPGHMAGNAQKRWKPIGTILTDHEGYRRIKVRERVPGDGENGWNANVWPLLHHQVWRQHKGPIPKGFIVTFKDGDRSNCAFENLDLMSKADNARRNAMWNRYPEDLKKVIMLNGALKRKMRKIDGQK